MKTRSASMSVARLIAGPAAVVLSAGLALASPTPTVRTLALTGQQAPGTAAGTLFSLFGPAEFDGAPSIGADSTVAFAGVLSDGTAGFWLDQGAGPQLLARSGTQAPGAEPGVVFRQRIAEAIIFTPPLLVPGHAALHNTLTGPGVGFNNDAGLWRTTSAGLVLVMREGDPAPGLPGVTFSSTGLRAIDNAGRVIFSSTLLGAVTGDNDESIWRAAPGAGPELLVREGSPAPGAGPGVVYSSSGTPSAFPFVLGNSAGDVLFQGNLSGPGTAAGNDEALFIRDASGTRLFIREGDPVPGLPGFVFRAGSTAGFHQDDIAFGDDGHVAITARASDGNQSLSAFLSDVGGSLSVIVRSGDPAPGTQQNFDLLVGPVINARGDIAFAGTTSGSSFPPLGLWIHSAGGLRALAVPDGQVSGQPEATTLQSVRSVCGFNADGFLLFTADLHMPGGQFSTALLLADPTGTIGILARTGGTLAVAPGDVRTVTRVITRQRALSDDAHAAFALAFTDGSSGHFVAALGSPSQCYANCDDSTAPPILNVNDFTCFLNRFAAGDSYANCDGSTLPPVLNVNDFACFLGRFAAGCP